MSRTLRLFLIAALPAAVSACALDPAGDAPRTELQSTVHAGVKLEFPSAALDDATAESASSASSPDDPANITANCSIVQFCNVPANLPNGADGTRCIMQSGCTVQQAFEECIQETTTVCGQASCPWKFVFLDGSRGTITPCP